MEIITFLEPEELISLMDDKEAKKMYNLLHKRIFEMNQPTPPPIPSEKELNEPTVLFSDPTICEECGNPLAKDRPCQVCEP